MVQLHHTQDEIHARDGQLVVIGNGGSNFIAGFRAATGFDGLLYTDPSLKSYGAMRLRRSIGSSLNPRSLGRAVGAFRSGFRQQKVMGDAWQQGGVFVVASSGEIHFSFRAEFAGDVPKMGDVLAAIERAVNKSPARDSDPHQRVSH